MLQDLLTTLPFIVCSINTILLLLSWHHHRDSVTGWLLAWSAVTTMLYGCHFLYFHHAVSILPVSNTIYTACNLAVYPLYLIYISEQTDQQPLSERPAMMAGLLAPSALGCAAVGILFLLMDEASTRHFIEESLYHGRSDGLQGAALWLAYVHHACHILFALQVVGVAITGIRKVKRYHQQLERLFADTDDKTLHAISIILKLLVATSFVSVVVNALGRQQFVGSLWMALPSLGFSALLFSIGWVGLHCRTTLRQLSTSVAEPQAPNTPNTISRHQQAKLGEQLEKLMVQERIFLQQDLRLDEVAQMLGTNRTYLLATLRNQMGMTFKEYVNRQRIAYAEELMERVPTMSKGEVATQAGYGTPSSFYRNLKVYGKHK